MPPEALHEFPGYALTLADAGRFVIRPGDREADRVVRAFAAAAALPAASDGMPGRRLLAVTETHNAAPWLSPDDPALPLVCPLPPPTDPDMLAIAMTQLTLGIAYATQRRGGLLLHAALATWPAGGAALGVLFVAPGATGKSTASRRLPPPWRSVCDDTTLVVRDGRGRYWAHPVPTWSRFYTYTGAPGGVWEMQAAFPLHAVFFLSQAEADGVEPLESASCAVALLAESAEQVGRPLRRYLTPAEEERLNRERLANVEALAHAVPAWRLHLSLNGAFWNPVERALAGLAPAPHADGRGAPEPEVTGRVDGRFIVYTGPSMNPTLAEPDVLEIMPTAGQSPRVGDVIYFLPAGGDRGIVHRVVALTPLGIRTRGDHKASDDLEPVQPAEVVGRVVAAHRGSARRAVPGGWPGRLDRVRARLHDRLARLAVRLMRGLYRRTARVVAGRLPDRLQPRLVRFSARGRDHDKLLLGARTIGRYDLQRRHWVIRFPFRLLVDEAALPCPPPDPAPPPE